MVSSSSMQVHKIVLLGDKASGKTSLAKRWVNQEGQETIDGGSGRKDDFSTGYKSTVGLDIYEKTLTINYDPQKSRKSNLFPLQPSNNADELQVKMQIWDVSGDLIHDEYLMGYILYGCSAICKRHLDKGFNCLLHCFSIFVVFCYDISSFLMFQDLAQIWHPAVMRLYVPFAPPGQLAVRRRAKRSSSSGKKRQAGNGTRSNMNLERGSVVSLAQGDKGFFEQHASQSNLRSSMVLGGSRTSFASLAPTNNATATKSNMNMMGGGEGEGANAANSGHNTNHNLTTSRPYFALIGTKNDLSYSRAVNLDTHQRFAYEQNMYTYFVSAKTGEKVQSCFHRIACDLSGVVAKSDQKSIGLGIGEDRVRMGYV